VVGQLANIISFTYQTKTKQCPAVLQNYILSEQITLVLCYIYLLLTLYYINNITCRNIVHSSSSKFQIQIVAHLDDTIMKYCGTRQFAVINSYLHNIRCIIYYYYKYIYIRTYSVYIYFLCTHYIYIRFNK